ncbi:unnamed protein product [Meganyctiphanes norvegica]|uniref:Uncharacterized protein n=1 Tax=Meganyctiphanes norvegica TaxID=48144 RepID=A0AAV2R492_MEGNR
MMVTGINFVVLLLVYPLLALPHLIPQRTALLLTRPWLPLESPSRQQQSPGNPHLNPAGDGHDSTFDYQDLLQLTDVALLDEQMMTKRLMQGNPNGNKKIIAIPFHGQQERIEHLSGLRDETYELNEPKMGYQKRAFSLFMSQYPYTSYNREHLAVPSPQRRELGGPDRQVGSPLRWGR